MTEKLADLIRKQGEEIWISLQEAAGQQQLELRVYERAATGAGAVSRPGREAVTVPVGLLPALIQALSRAQDTLEQRGLLYIPQAPRTAQSTPAEPSNIQGIVRPRSQPTRKHPRISLNIRGECRLLDSNDFWPTKPMPCEIRDVSLGGAQVGLSRPLPRFAQVELSMVVDGTLFRARAEVVGVESSVRTDPAQKFIRHNLRWGSLEGPAGAALTKILESRQKPQSPAEEDSPS